nr:nucleotide-binding alpha-beta plait domain-containing protein [Tanacetum cinerariifolium]
MGIFRTKEDEVSKILTSIFVSNFLDFFSLKDLFHACKQYGHVVDSFIPSKRAKDGKRLGFVRFINVFSVERLVNNLCTIWVGRLKLNANVVRFNRENLKSIRIVDKTAKWFNKSSHNTFHKTVGNKDIGNSFVNVVKGSGMSLETKSNPMIVLDDECFDVLKISYLGELWVLIEFESAKVKDLFKEMVEQTRSFRFLFKRLRILLWEGESLGWKFRVFPLNSGQNILESFKIFFRGKVYWMRAKEVPGWTSEFTEEEEKDDVSVEDNHGGIHSDQEIINCNDESDVEEVPETCFNVPEGQKGNPSKDPFGIYPLLNKDKNIREHKINEEESSLKYPSGFTPIGNLNEGHLDGGCAKKVNEEVAGGDNSFMHTVGGKENSGSVNKMLVSMGSCRLKKSGMPRTGGSILSFMEEVVKVGQTMRYNMDGCVKDITEIIKSQGEFGVHK